VHLAFPILFTLVPVGLVLKQPDLGTALLLLFISLTMILFAKLRWTAVVTFVAIGAIALPLTWTFGLSDYQKDRIHALFNPEVDQKKKGWQSNQAVIATSSGQLAGKGFRQGTQTQLRYVPEQWNDFAFSGWAEEWGFLGCFFLLALYFFLVIWSLYISSQARERLGAFLAVGFGALIFWHVFVNVGMVTRLLPVVGIPLPFYSYGGSAILTMMIGVGALMSVSARRST
jgi:rod shape determining protein RodA